MANFHFTAQKSHLQAKPQITPLRCYEKFQRCHTRKIPGYIVTPCSMIRGLYGGGPLAGNCFLHATAEIFHNIVTEIVKVLAGTSQFGRLDEKCPRPCTLYRSTQ